MAYPEKIRSIYQEQLKGIQAAGLFKE